MFAQTVCVYFHVGWRIQSVFFCCCTPLKTQSVFCASTSAQAAAALGSWQCHDGASCRRRLPVAGAGCRLPVPGCRCRFPVGLPFAGAGAVCRLPVPVADIPGYDFFEKGLRVLLIRCEYCPLKLPGTSS